MDIRKIDKNFNLPQLTEQDVVWYNATQPCFSLHGARYDEKVGKYCRMPIEEGRKVNDGFEYGAGCTASVRIRFQTNSPYLAIKAVIPTKCVMNHMPLVGASGFALYVNGKFYQMFTPEVKPYTYSEDEEEFAFQGVARFTEKKVRNMELYFPLYNGVKELFIGVKEQSEIAPISYPTDKKVVFYGSSITQGGCASRPGNDYIAHLSRWLNVDCLNLGTSGSARGELAMADYLITLDVDVYVIDYDHNAPNVEFLQSTYFPFYERIRANKPLTPIVFISKPDFKGDDDVKRKKVIYQAYKTAQEQGDNNVYFIDGETLFGTEDSDACTVDGCHPNDLGFYRMAKGIYPVLKKVLG